MKNIFNYLLFTLAVAFVFTACKKDENRIFFEGGTAPVLSANRTSTIPLSFPNQTQEAITLSWTNPDYKFTTGISSHDVLYTVEIDTVGANFTNPQRQTITINGSMELMLTQHQLNDYLLNQLELIPGMAHQLEIRVTSSIGGSVPLVSNKMQFTVTPYAIPPKVEKYTDKVYIVGSATPGGWNNPVPEPAQELTKISEQVYEITLTLTGGGSYLFLPENGSWNRKYGFDGANNTNNPNGGDFKREGGDILAPASGNYKIELNFQTGKFKVTPI